MEIESNEGRGMLFFGNFEKLKITTKNDDTPYCIPIVENERQEKIPYCVQGIDEVQRLE